MKICLTTPYYKPVKGGISNYVLHMSNALKDKEQEVYIVTRQGTAEDESVYLVDTSKTLFVLKAFLRFWNLKPDILHSHSSWYTLAPCTIYKFFRPTTVVVHTLHTDPIKNINKVKRIILSLLLSNCNAITCVSMYLLNKTQYVYDIQTKTVVIYGGTNSNTIDNKSIESFQEKYSLQGKYPIICFVGVLSWKPKADGVKILVKSFEQIVKKYPDSRLIIAGDGIYKKEIELLAEDLGIDSKIIFTGFVDNSLIPLNVCDIYAHISLQEGFPLAILEAMSCEKAVIASKTGGIPELITDEENGLLVESTPEAISTAVVDLVDSPEKRSNLGYNAKKTVKEKYQWSIIADNFINLYQICKK
jgi:L-malate glycosyltransferase